MSKTRVTDLSDDQLEAALRDAEELAEMEETLARHPDVLRLLLNVDPSALALAAITLQLAQGQPPPIDARLRKVAQTLQRIDGKPRDLAL